MKNKSVLTVIALVIMMTAVGAFVTLDNWTESGTGQERSSMPIEPNIKIFLTAGLDNYDIPVLTYDEDDGTYTCDLTIYVLEGYEDPKVTGGGNTYSAAYRGEYRFGSIYAMEVYGIVSDITFNITATPTEYPVNYDLNGGEGTGPASINVAYRSTFKAAVPENARAFEEGNVFKGWSTSPAGGVQYKAGATVTMSTIGGMTLYAVWGEPAQEIGGGSVIIIAAIIALAAVGGVAIIALSKE
ncbi:MAG: InlB B-repeat-containing protein [Methanomassiliicoccaceae archaeon]|nr:InlB B-repeat-containing protein [Methanomassiliicoccaceae archaeon]